MFSLGVFVALGGNAQFGSEMSLLAKLKPVGLKLVCNTFILVVSQTEGGLL